MDDADKEVLGKEDSGAVQGLATVARTTVRTRVNVQDRNQTGHFGYIWRKSG